MCAIIPIYDPESGLIERIDRIKCEVRHIIVIINRCNEYILTDLTESLSNQQFHHIISNPYNRGLGHALNQGMDIAYSLDLEWVLLLDQDSDPDAGVVGRLSAVLSAMPALPAIIGLNYRDIHTGQTAFRCRRGNPGWATKTTVITSGTLLNLEHAKHIGPFKSEYFIDSIDHEFCLRARTLGYEIHITCSPMMTHSIGLQKNTILNRLQCMLSQPHSPERKYYQARNIVVTAKNYFRKFPFWSLRQFLRIPADILSTLLFERPKFKKINYSLQGLASGLNSDFKPGPLETDIAQG